MRTVTLSYTSWLQDPEGIAELASRQFLKLLTFSAAPIIHDNSPNLPVTKKELLIFFPEIQIKSYSPGRKTLRELKLTILSLEFPSDSL